MAEKEYLIFCDESERKGKYYSNFYGGLMVGGSQYARITERLNAKKQELHLFGEVKWEKVTERYLAKYQELIRCLFQEVSAGNVRVRIMFRHNAHRTRGLSAEHLAHEYFILYYQFIKHAFGLVYMPPQVSVTRLRLYFDLFPDTRENAERFKGFLLGLPQNTRFRHAKLELAKQDITEVRSHDHVLLQCLDIVLGAMAFRLNDKHKEKIPGKRIRGKKTRAKELLYKTILAEIHSFRPRFNIGVSTGVKQLEERWSAPYQHWVFEPKNSDFEVALTKQGNKK